MRRDAMRCDAMRCDAVAARKNVEARLRADDAKLHYWLVVAASTVENGELEIIAFRLNLELFRSRKVQSAN